MIADYFKTQPVVKAWLFGSFVHGEEMPLSDVGLMQTVWRMKSKDYEVKEIMSIIGLTAEEIKGM